MLCLPFYVKYLRSCIIAQRRTTMLCAKNKHIGQTGDRQFFLIRPLWQGFAMHWPDFFSPGCPRGWSPIKGHLACMMTRWPDWTSLFVSRCWLLNFSISFDSFTSLLTLISNQLRCLCSMITVPSRPGIANWLRQVRCSQSSWNYMDNFHTLPTAFSVQFQSCVLLCQIG